MGRYFQHAAWPEFDHELEATLDPVPESLVAFSASGGPHLITLKFQLTNGTAGSVNFIVDLFLDGVALTHFHAVYRLAGGILSPVNLTALVEIEAGPHTLEARVSGTAVAADIINAQSGTITSLELNLQEASDRIG
jgi:hypothetical protein